VTTLLGVKDQLVKRRRLFNNIAASMDRFCESTRKIEKLKLKVLLKICEDTKKLELEMFK
jgi:hypothetical protein